MQKSIERIKNKDSLKIFTYKLGGHTINHDEFIEIGKFMNKIFIEKK